MLVPVAAQKIRALYGGFPGLPQRKRLPPMCDQTQVGVLSRVRLLRDQMSHESSVARLGEYLQSRLPLN